VERRSINLLSPRLRERRVHVRAFLPLTLLLLFLTLTVLPVGASAATRPAVYVVSYKSEPCGPGAPSTCRRPTVPEQHPSFSSSCINKRVSAIGRMSLVARKTKPALGQVWSVQFQFHVGAFQMNWTGTWTSTALAPFSGSGSGTWQAAGLRTVCRRVGGQVERGRVRLQWTQTGDELVARYEFVGFP